MADLTLRTYKINKTSSNERQYFKLLRKMSFMLKVSNLHMNKYKKLI